MIWLAAIAASPLAGRASGRRAHGLLFEFVGRASGQQINKISDSDTHRPQSMHQCVGGCSALWRRGSDGQDLVSGGIWTQENLLIDFGPFTNSVR